MKQIIATLICFAFLSCEESIDIKSDNDSSQIVLNSIISTDSVWRVNLSYSKSIFSPDDFELIDDASVKVNNLNNGQSFFLESKGNGCYGRALNPNEGHNYELVITTKDSRIVKARTYVPSVLEVDVVKNSSIDMNGDETIEIDIEIEDNPDEDNFYVWELVENTAPIVEEQPNDAPIENLDINYSIASEDEGEDENLKTLNSQIFVSDKEFTGKKYAARVTIGKEVLENIQNPELPAGESHARFSLRVMAVSADLFEYLRTYELYRQSEIKVTSISQPVSVYSNIEHGLGIFGGYLLKEFPIQ